ncbi:MAG: Formate dehydrogenase, nitrate-inducible, iron-sulfur subunit [Acidobacteria bacterium ADurb.Bin340]|nr:MAG: Formate dehydrogenase, nitrate-inducible, iron-sulfur subunit [Acidobacteria bacterium ADurb.Bin340]HQL47450.1 4Fe-4S dicluster domain-containing protein [Holophaga sp.]
MAQKKALLIDISLCVGCNACQDACKVENNLAPGEEKALSPTAYTALDDYDGVFVRRLCQHCEVPTCVSVCPVGAFTKTPEGPVLYDAGKCIGCRYCMQACPFNVPRYEWASTRPRVQKCIFCAPRLAKGLPTACAEACPTGATVFGDRDEMLRQALEHIAARPKELVHRIYGREEVGGTSVFYLSPVPFERLGFETTLGSEPLPMLTMSALSKVPNVVAVGGTLLAGIWWITNRRDDVRRHEAERPDAKHQDGSES